MSYRSKRARLAQASKVKDKDTTTQLVDDTIAQVIHDVASGEPQAPETLLSSSYDPPVSTNQPSQPLQDEGTTTEADDDFSKQRYASRRQPLTPSLGQSLISGSSRQLRTSRRQSGLVQVPNSGVDAEAVHASETQVSSYYKQRTDDPTCIEPAQNDGSNANDDGDHPQNTGGRHFFASQPSRPIVDSPRQFKESNRQPLWCQDNEEGPSRIELSQARPSKHATWSNDIEFDEAEEVEMRDLEGKRGKKGGKILPRHVWSLQPGVRFVVPFNALDQPVKKGGSVLVRFLGDIARNGELCPIGEVNWHKVDKSCKADIVTLVREKFVIPNREEIDKAILKRVGNTWRSYRHELKVQYKKPNKTQEQVASVVPKGLAPNQWIKLVQYWFSDKSQFLSTKGREARAALSHIHTSGSKSFAQKRDEFEKVHGREPGPLEWFIQTHKKKDGTYADNSSKEFLDAAATMIAQRTSTSSSAQHVAIENQVFNELMYSDDERYNRPIGYGFGASRDKVFGVKAELRKKRYLSSGTCAETMSVSRNKMNGVGVEPKKSGLLGSNSSAEVDRLKFSVAALSETHELLQTQLQMQSQQLQMQSQQLQIQSQQMEGLRFQLQQVTSLLTKFGVMLNKPLTDPAPRSFPCRGLSFADSQAFEALRESSDGGSESSEWESD